jgi:uncharacterized protein (TIGR02466 family)
MNEKSLIPLFSKPVFKTYLNTTNVDLSEIQWAQNYQNWISTSQNVLSESKYSNLLSGISDGLSEYFYGVMGANQDVEIYITESWFNKTECRQSHHRHWHPNSIVSGVVFLESAGDSGRIKFITSQFDTIEYNIVEANLYNSRSWSMTPEVGSMILFPSNVEHLVEEYIGETPRISLAFNTFVKGNINLAPLTRLVI